MKRRGGASVYAHAVGAPWCMPREVALPVVVVFAVLPSSTEYSLEDLAQRARVSARWWAARLLGTNKEEEEEEEEETNAITRETFAQR